jgi:transcription factor SPT20
MSNLAQQQSLLDDIRAHRIPVDFLELFDSAKVPFYDGVSTRTLSDDGFAEHQYLGCMIVELLDYRPQKLKEPALEKPERTRVVLHPNSETLWADICLLNQKAGNQWTDQDALEIEARLLVRSENHDILIGIDALHSWQQQHLCALILIHI